MNRSEDRPLVTIITCCWNRGEALWETLNSVLEQSYENWEHICVDDMSKDNTHAVLEQYQKIASDKVRILETHLVNGEKKMIPHNLGYEAARGKYVIVLDHDDVLTPDCLEKCVCRAEEVGADVVIPDLMSFEDVNDMKVAHTGLCGCHDLILSGREAFMMSLDWQIHGFDLWASHLIKNIPIKDDEPCYDWGELAVRQRYVHCKKVAFAGGSYCYRKTPGGINGSGFKRYSHTRLTTNREILKELRNGCFPKQILNDYSIDTYRSFCAIFSRFVLSALFRKNAEARHLILAELRAYFDDPRLLDKKLLRNLCPGVLDRLRLSCFLAVVPITMWRKCLNRILHRVDIF